MSDRMDMTRIVTKHINLDEVPQSIVMLRDARHEAKITCVAFDWA